MKTLEFEARKAELAREILCNDSAEVIDAVKKAYHRITKRMANKPVQTTPCQYTVEELKAEIERSHEAIATGRTHTAETMTQYFNAFDYEG